MQRDKTKLHGVHRSRQPGMSYLVVAKQLDIGPGLVVGLWRCGQLAGTWRGKDLLIDPRSLARFLKKRQRWSAA